MGGMDRLKMKRLFASCALRRVAVVLSVVLALVLVWAVSISIWIVRGGALNPDARGDAAIVLGAAVWQGRPSPVFAERINHAIRLYKQRQVRCVIVTGGVGKDDTLSEGEVARRYAVARGVPSGDILVENRSTDTSGNLSGARSLMERRGLRSAVLVSDPYHLRRASILAGRQSMEVVLSPTPTTRFSSARAKLHMLLREIWFTTRLLTTGR